LQTSDALGAAASQVGPDAQAAVASLNKEAGLSHAKIAACLESLFGTDLTRGASAQIVLRAAQRLEPAYEEIRQATRDAEQLAVDETGWRLGGQPAWLHVWVSQQATCYAVDRRRSADVLQEVIGLDWEGVLSHDGFSSYDRFLEALHQQCVAHLLRRAREMLETATRGAVRFPRQVIDLFAGAVHLRNEFLAGRVPAAVWECARDEYELRLLPLLGRPRAGANETLAQHIRNHFASWFTFLTDAAVPATNWEAEQATRPAVVNRKVWGGNRTESGAKAQGVLSSVLQTCKKQGKAALDFVSQTLRAFGNRLLPTPILLGTR
jgi:transposase